MKKRGFSTKAFVLVLALVLALGCVIGGTIAWLTAKTAPVVNTFTVGDISITLTETTDNFKMVPGNTIAKDPVVTVKADSEDCWLFVKIEKANDLDTYITYTVDSGWTALTGVDGVYYRTVSASNTDQVFNVLKDNQVTVKDTVTKEMMEGLKAETAELPTLTFTAYAVQKDNVATAADAWTKANSSTNP